MSIVGDAYARPIVEELRRGPYDLSSLALASAPAARRPATRTRRRCSSCCPSVIDRRRLRRIRDRGHGFRRHAGARHAPGFAPAAGAAVISADRCRFLEPGDDEIGWTARRGRVPLGYLGDQDEDRGHVPDRRRRALRGARRPGPALQADGTITMLGRDSMVVNTGGEKVFVEEVEEACSAIPTSSTPSWSAGPSERFGQEVVAVVEPAATGPRSTPPSCVSSSPSDRPLQGAARGRRLRRRSSATPTARPTTGGRARSPSTRPRSAPS